MAFPKITPLIDYPTFFGKKKVCTFDWNGPTNYQGAAPSVINASDLGWGGIDFGTGCVSVSGTYGAEIQFTGTGPQKSVKIIVNTVATGALLAGPTDLSAETFRLQLQGS